MNTALAHVQGLVAALTGVGDWGEVLDRWAARLALVLNGGGRLLVAGNGGSAAQAQHLSAELVGRYHDDRRPYSAIALTAEPPELTALVNDYGAGEVFARQVRAHGRPGDVLLLLSTSGASTDLLAAVPQARAAGITTWALTGAAPNPLASLADESIAVAAASSANVQEVHLVLIHLLCEAFDRHCLRGDRDLRP